MSETSDGPNEVGRLAALRALELLDTPPEAEFDAVVAAAQHLFDCKMAYVSLIDANRQWFKARCGIDATETARDVSFCTHVVATDAMLVIPDTLGDDRFSSNPHVVGPPYVRFYVGVPLHASAEHDGVALPVATLCVADDRPHDPEPEKLEVLRGLARVVEALLAARRVSRESLRLAIERQDAIDEMTRTQRLLQHAERMARIGSWRLELASGQVHWSEQTYAIHGLEPHAQEPLATALSFYGDEDRSRLETAIEACASDGTPWDIEVDLTDARGLLRRVRTLGEIEERVGERVAIMGVIQDVTDRYRYERHLREVARTDELTGMPSRRAFNEELGRDLQDADRSEVPVALAIIDLDRFKEVNDRLGHAAGDEVLVAMANKLQAADYLGDRVTARFGGDEFVLLMRGEDVPARLSINLPRLLGDLCYIAGHGAAQVQVTATIGACVSKPRQCDRSTLLKLADDALYRAKSADRGTAAIARQSGLISADPRSRPLAKSE